MRKRLLVLCYVAAFWLLFEIAIRALFLGYNHDFAAELTAGDVTRIFLYGLKMDVSLAGYFLAATGLLLTISMLTSARWPYTTINGLHFFAITICGLLVIVDLELYRHWGFRLNAAPFVYLQHTGPEALGSVAITVVIKLLLIGAALVTLFLFAYDRVVAPRVGALVAEPGMTRSFVLLGVTALMFLPIRGSLTVAPMNTGFVYFHKTKAFANHSAINVVWNFLYNLRKQSRLKYPEDMLPRAVAEQHYRALFAGSDSSCARVWTKERPNIILFILESFTADVIGPLGGRPDVTPNLNKLFEEGVAFTNFYSSGDRTDKGLISILSGYPAQPVTSIIKDPSKTQRLPYLNHYMEALGYQTSFVYGGDVDFANFRSYLTNSRFGHITSEDEFPAEYNQSKWGVHDHIVFQQALVECDTATQPFFKVILSLSSHEPFDVPMIARFPGMDGENLFINSCYYTDRSVGEFITKAKASSWWENTVVVFVADHGHRLPGNKEIKDKERYRIPMLMVGGAVKKDSVVHTYASQTDIPNTLLGQLGTASPAFSFSRNILCKETTSFAAYFFNDGYGFVTPDQYIIFDNIGKQFLRQDGSTPEHLERSKAFEQVLFIDYNNK